MNCIRFCATSCAILSLFTITISQSLPSMPMGMNVGSLNYYSEVLIFNDVMTTASTWLTYHAGSGWNTDKADQLETDEGGYPVELPQAIDGNQTMVRFLINNNYEGKYRFQYDGEGTLTWNVDHSIENGHDYITLSGEGGHKWIQITSSTRGNHIRNIRILPENLADTYDPNNPEHLFNAKFCNGLRPFHALRFMDWIHTNGSKAVTWDARPTPGSYSQGTDGVCIEYAIKLCNYLQKDAWFCLPHAADDNYIIEHAKLVRDNLHSGLKAYVEYSNEIWNWQFSQAHWVGKNGRDGNTALDAHDSIYQQLRTVGQEYCNDPESYCHPEKDAHMMQRTFNIWKSVFEETASRDRMIRVAAIQAGWCSNTSRVLAHLAKHGGADAVSPTMYFNFTENDHTTWNSMDPSAVTPQMIIKAVADRMDDPEYFSCVQTTADQAKEYGLKVVIYEAGQHMQPWNQGDYAYNQAVWDAQRHQGMYALYVKNWRACDSIYAQAGGIALNCAFAYVSERESKYGSWGHLESLFQLDSMDRIREIAPKYAALLDMNAPLPQIAVLPRDLSSLANGNAAVQTLFAFNKNGSALVWKLDADAAVGFELFDASGRRVLSKRPEFYAAGAYSTPLRTRTSSGLYLLRTTIIRGGHTVVLQRQLLATH